METTKLTLSMDRGTIETAKRIARNRRTSVSAMFREIVHDLARDEDDDFDIEKLHPHTRELLGMAKTPIEKTDRELLEEALWEKYGLDE